MPWFFSKQPNYLRVVLYEKGKYVDLDKLHPEQLELLRKAILEHWKTSPQSAVFFDCQVYERRSWCQKQSASEFNIECYNRNSDRVVGYDQIPIARLYTEKMTHKKFTLSPEENIFYKWPQPITAEFYTPS